MEIEFEKLPSSGDRGQPTGWCHAKCYTLFKPRFILCAANRHGGLEFDERVGLACVFTWKGLSNFFWVH